MSAQKITSGILGGILLTLPFSAQAQVDNRQVMERMDKLEHDLMVIQRQQAQGGSAGPAIQSQDVDSPGGITTAVTNNPASVEVQLSNIEDELRKLRGRIEENEFQSRQLSERLNKFQQDTEYRLNEMANARQPAAEPKMAAPAPAPQAAAPATGGRPPEKSMDAPVEKPDTSAEAVRPKGKIDTGEESTSLQTTAGDGELKVPEGGDGETFDSPRDEYNYAFRLLNQTRYEDAAKYFKDFTGKYPHDPLIGNAYYWLGETFYIRHDYVKAGDSFRQGFEALPSGPKAADNLLKLAMSLGAMNKNKESCVVLDQLMVKFKDTSPSVAQKAHAERNRLGCK